MAGMDGHVTRRHVAPVWLSLGTRDFRKKKSDPLLPESGKSIKRLPNQVSVCFKKV